MSSDSSSSSSSSSDSPDNSNSGTNGARSSPSTGSHFYHRPPSPPKFPSQQPKSLGESQRSSYPVAPISTASNRKSEGQHPPEENGAARSSDTGALVVVDLGQRESARDPDQTRQKHAEPEAPQSSDALQYSQITERTPLIESTPVSSNQESIPQERTRPIDVEHGDRDVGTQSGTRQRHHTFWNCNLLLQAIAFLVVFLSLVVTFVALFAALGRDESKPRRKHG